MNFVVYWFVWYLRLGGRGARVFLCLGQSEKEHFCG